MAAVMPDQTGFLDAAAGTASSSTEQVLGLLDGRRLSPAQRRIGQFLIDHLAEVVFMSSVDLAEQDDRVVDDRVEFALGDGVCVSERVTGSAGYLRRAAQRIRILHTVTVGPAMRRHDAGVLEQRQ